MRKKSAQEKCNRNAAPVTLAEEPAGGPGGAPYPVETIARGTCTLRAHFAPVMGLKASSGYLQPDDIAFTNGETS